MSSWPKFFPGKRFLVCLALSGLLWLSIGCGGNSTLAPVTGKVTLNGAPLTSGTVNFHPNKDKGNTFGGECLGEINAQGEYTLQTNGKPGAPAGWYKVTVLVNGPTTPDNTNPNLKPIINSTYSLPGTTPLEKEVVEKPAPGAYDLPVGP